MIQTVTIGLSAFLLFMLQPMISKIILPDFGGGSSIWLISLIFFQVLLLGGYSFSHFLASKLKPVKQGILYGGMLLLSLLFIPVQVHFRQSNLSPTLHIFLLLLFTIGLPYFLLSTTSPMVQSWIAVGDGKRKRNPYVMYAVSNAGSLTGLLAYPTLIEPNLSNSTQTALLSYGYVLYTGLILVCLVIFMKAGFRPGNPGEIEPGPVVNRDEETISWGRRLSWLGMALVPSAALMVFTHHLTVDIVNFPLLWVIPLALYLISFVVVFLKPAVSKPGLVRTFFVILPVLALTLALRNEFNIPFAWRIVATCACLFAICIFFHGNLERDKPEPKNLTSFYLFLSLGGSLGGILVGIVAPMVFDTAFELYIVLIVSFYFILLPYFKKRRQALKVYFQSAAALLLVLTFFTQEILHHHNIVFKTRSFYGIYTIRELPEIPGKQIAARTLSQGTTIHGGQARNFYNQLIPISYFHEGTGVGQAFLNIPDVRNVGVVGLGTGMVSLYSKRGQTFDFFEIDPTVVEIAKNHFRNLASSRAWIRHIIGDARLELRNIPNNSYDFLVLDAFTSGAIPTHLLTMEAMKEYLRVLRDDGVILFHITNRYIDLMPVLNCAAKKLNLHVMHHYSQADPMYHWFAAHWAILTKSRTLLEKVTGAHPGWLPPEPKTICWTDEFSNLWSVIKLSDS